MLGDSVTMSQSLMITVFSMVIVFLSLLIISYLIDGLRAISTKDKKEETKDNIPSAKEVVEEQEDSSNDVNEEELVAVITAAIAASMGVNVSDLKINNIKRVSPNTPVWANVGRQEQIFNRL